MEKETVVVSKEEIIKEAERLLIRSSYKAKARTEKRIDYINKGIKYELAIGKGLIRQVKSELPDKWNEWASLTHEFLVHGREYGMRPTIDRMDSDKSYHIDNINFLTFDSHMEKDNLVPVTVYDMQKQSINQYRTSDATSDVLECSGASISRYLDSGLPFRNRYLLQAEGVNKSKNNNKAKRETKMLAIANVIIEKFDDNDKVIRSFSTQIKSIVSFDKLEIRRQGV